MQTEYKQRINIGWILFFLIIIFMYTNGMLFTWLFAGTPLNAWRQLSWLVLFILLYSSYRKYNNVELYSVINFSSIYLVILLFLSAYTFIYQGFNLVRVFYSWWLYLVGVPFVLFAPMVVKAQINKKWFFGIFTYMGLFITLGLFIDYRLDGLITRTLHLGFSEGDLADQFRLCFLSEAPTTFAVIYSFFSISAIAMMKMSKTWIMKSWYSIIAVSSILGAWMTGSRQIVLCLAIILIIGFVYYIFFVKDSRKYFMIIPLTIVFASLPWALGVTHENNVYVSRFDHENIKEDDRYLTWKRGYQELFVDAPLRSWCLGNGIGYASGQQARSGEALGSHYENTYLARFNEMGVWGIVLLLYPVFFVIKKINLRSYIDVLILLVLITFLIVSMISPNGNSPTTQIAVYLSLGVFIERRYFAI